MIENKEKSDCMTEPLNRKEMQQEKKKIKSEKRKRMRARGRAERKYERQLAKEGRTTKSRKVELDRYRMIEKKLLWAIGIMVVLLLILYFFIFNY